ncbi:hypothetical protein BDV93DRAFT_545552 [Ceratobasidium sp. AG-I]|nr:hypothetical protein BDV93DRAFT_545552 [Ceratobasidium sp. AG-I]
MSSGTTELGLRETLDRDLPNLLGASITPNMSPPKKTRSSHPVPPVVKMYFSLWIYTGNESRSDLLREPETFEVEDEVNKQLLHVLFYGPYNKNYTCGQGGEKSPGIANPRGGPTSKFPPGLKWLVRYRTNWSWEKRGNIGVEGRVANVAELSNSRPFNMKRAAIRGGSAGLADLESSELMGGSISSWHSLKRLKGYVTGTSGSYLTPSLFNELRSCEVSDLAVLEADTHKFEGTFAQTPRRKNESGPRNQGGQVKYMLFSGEGHGVGLAWAMSVPGIDMKLQWLVGIQV